MLNLVDSWSESGSLDDSFDVRWSKVGDTDRLDFAGLLELDHGLPSVDQGSLGVQVGKVLVLLGGGHELVEA